MTYFKKPRIVEEVPGVPEDEQYYVSLPGHVIVAHVRTLSDAMAYCFDHGIVNYEIERFEP